MFKFENNSHTQSNNSLGIKHNVNEIIFHYFCATMEDLANNSYLILTKFSKKYFTYSQGICNFSSVNFSHEQVLSPFPKFLRSCKAKWSRWTR